MNIKKKEIYQWAEVCNVLSNFNRLSILILLEKESLSVGDIANNLNISLKATSNHLAILRNVKVVSAKGSQGRVYYSLQKPLPEKFAKALHLIWQNS